MKDYSSIVVSSKVKLLRNLIGFSFPPMLVGDEGIKTLNKLADTFLKIDKTFKLFRVSSLPELDLNIMHEKQLISNKLMLCTDFGGELLSQDESVSIMLNESDHIVEQCTLPGLNLILAYDKINALDNQMLSNLDIAYDDSIGFLTSNINDVGTGMRATIKLFLPALTILGRVREIITSVSNLGIEVNSFLEDEIDTRAYTYNVSNVFTIGKKETDYVVKITESVIKICEMEIRARTELMSASNIDEVKDKVYRAWGLLTNCYKIGVEESQKLLGELKMGVSLDLIRFKDVDFIDKIMIDILPYSLTKISNSKVAISDLDKYRATFLANVLKSKRIK